MRISPLAALLAALAASGTAAAAPSTRLVYGRGPGAEKCSDESGLRQAVAARVGYDPFFPWAPVTVTVEVTAEGKRLRGRVVVVDAEGIEKGAQTLESVDGSCEDLLASIALAVSVALDAATETKADVTPAPPPADTAPPPRPPPVVVDVPALSPQKKDAPALPRDARPARPLAPLSLWVAPGARASVGAWSAASLGPDVLVELRAGWVGLGVEGRYDLATVGVGATAQASVQRVTGALLPCAHVGWLVGCGLATFGETWARGDVAAPQTQSAPYVALGGRVGVDVKLLTRLHLLGTVDVVGIATRTVIGIDSATTPNGPVEASAGIALLVPVL